MAPTPRLRLTPVESGLESQLRQPGGEELLVKGELVDITAEDRYLTASWQQAEWDATKDYRKGRLRAYDSGDEMMDAMEETNA
jgi:hypothetical protein